MANRKQQKRRYERARAHNRAVDHLEADAEKPERKPAAASRSARRTRQAREPDWKRACLRAVAFAALFFGLQHFTGLGGKTSTRTQLLTAVLMFFSFAAIGIITERWVWRRQMKQRGEHAQP